MIICLSSGSNPRYRQDILRAIALPIGTNLQFRYDKRWISDALLQKIQDNSIAGQDVLIAYADQSVPIQTGAIQILPVRSAKVAYAAALGKTVVIIFTVDNFAYASNLTAFNEELTSLTGGSLPKWIEGKAQGKYCTELNSKPTNYVEFQGLGQWEEVVTQLANRSDFAQELAFVTVLGLMTESGMQKMGAELKHISWMKELGANTDIELVIYHYHPTKFPVDLQLTLSTGPEIHPQASPQCTLDSRYDLKKIHLQSGDPALGDIGSWINIILEGKDEISRLELETSVKVKGNQLKRSVIALFIAAGLSAAQIIPLLTRSDLTSENKALLSLVIFGFSLFVGAAAVWGIRRSL